MVGDDDDAENLTDQERNLYPQHARLCDGISGCDIQNVIIFR